MPAANTDRSSNFGEQRPEFGRFTSKQVCALVGGIVFVFLMYQPAWTGDFIWDDDAHITRPELRGGDGLRRIWTDFTATQQYYPVLHSAFWVQYRWFGDEPTGYHLVSLALHALNAVLLAAVLQRLRIRAVWLAAAIFALHPVMVESVAWITELKNTLSGTFYLSAALAYLCFDASRRRRAYLLALVFFLLALGTKTVTATLPAALLVVLWWQRGTLRIKGDIWPLLPFFSVGAISGLFTAMVEVDIIGAGGPDFTMTPLERLLLAGRALWFYVGKLVWPGELVFIYPRWHVTADEPWQFVFPIAACVVLFIFWKIRRVTRGPLAASLYFCGTLFPALGFFDVYPFLFSYVADHFQYLASFGVIVPAAILVHRVAARTPLATVMVIGLATGLGVLTRAQSSTYRNVETLYRTTLARNPECWMAHLNLGVLLDGKGEHREALVYHRAAVRLKPDHASARLNLGLSLVSIGRMAEAIPEFRCALELRPDYGKAHQNLAAALLVIGRPAEALPHFAAAVRLAPSALSHRGFGMALLQSSREREATAQFEAALRFEPEDVQSRELLRQLRSTLIAP